MSPLINGLHGLRLDRPKQRALIDEVLEFIMNRLTGGAVRIPFKSDARDPEDHLYNRKSLESLVTFWSMRVEDPASLAQTRRRVEEELKKKGEGR